MKAKLEKKIYGLIHALEEIQVEAQAFEERYEVQLRGVHPDQYKCGLNLLHYLALRQRDVSELQDDLGALGLSRLGRAEPHVLASVHAILHALRSLQGNETKLRKSPVTIKQGRKIIRKRTNALLGKKLKGSTVRIMVTLPSEAASKVDFGAAFGAMVLLDHAYVEYSDQDLTAVAQDFDNVVTVRTFSKAWGLAGCRVGYADCVQAQRS